MKRKPTIIEIIAFNLLETFLIFCSGHFIGLDLVHMILMTILYGIPRMIFKKASHYKSPTLCLVVSLALASAMFAMYRVYAPLGYVSAVFTGLILTERGDVTNIYQFAGEAKRNRTNSQYAVLFNYLKYNGLTDEYLQAEEILRKRLKAEEFIVYKRIFIDDYTWDEVQDELDIDRKQVQQALNKSYYFLIGRLGL